MYATGIPGKPTDIDAEVAAFGPGQFGKTLAKCSDELLEHRIVGKTAQQRADASHAIGLLRERRERPRSRRAAEQRDDKFSPPDVDCHATLRWGSFPCNGGTIPRFSEGRTMVLRCERLEPPMSQLGHGETNSLQSFPVRSIFNNGRLAAPQRTAG